VNGMEHGSEMELVIGWKRKWFKGGKWYRNGEKRKKG